MYNMAFAADDLVNWGCDRSLAGLCRDWIWLLDDFGDADKQLMRQRSDEHFPVQDVYVLERC